MQINRNTLNQSIEDPAYVLCKASGERVGIIQCTTEKSYDRKWLEPNEIHCDTNMMIDGKKNPIYDSIDIWKYIEVPDLQERFIITSVGVTAEGTQYESKSIEARSCEIEIGQAYVDEMLINEGVTGSLDGVVLYQPGNQGKSLLHLLINEQLKTWTIGHVDAALASMQRSFDWSRKDVYSILMEDIATAFDCYVIFDSWAKTINLYQLSTYSGDTNISVSFYNLLEKTEMSIDLDSIKTCLTVTGANDLNLREVNMSSDKIISLDYFHDLEYMSQSLYDAYTTWAALPNATVNVSGMRFKSGVVTQSEIQGKTNRQAFEILLNKYQTWYTNIHKQTSLNMPARYNERKIGYGVFYDPSDPYNTSKCKTFSKQTATTVVSSLPSSGQSTSTLYIVNNSSSYAMYRWTGSAWFNVNVWTGYALNILNEQYKSAENVQAVAMKAGYGNANSTDSTVKARYTDTYLPAYYTVKAIEAQIPVVESSIASLQSDQSYYLEYDKNLIVTRTSMNTNFTAAQLKELSTFFRNDVLSSDNFIVTDSMTDAERFDMLHAMLDYGTKELAKVSQPQLTFSATLANLFTIPAFDVYSGDFDVGNYIHVTIRDDYMVKPRLLTIHINFLDQTDFSVTFGNVARTARNIYTDIQDALNAATSAATSVSYNQSYWSASAEETDTIGKTLAEGLLSQGNYLKNGDDSELVMDSRGVFVTTTSGTYANKDAIFMGGGRILFTNDNWKTVSMSVGRANISYPRIQNNQITYVTESRFGTYADFVVAGYIGGSMIVGGDIYSSNYKTSTDKNSGNAGTHINLTDGTFEFNGKSNGKKRLTLNASGELEVNGKIHASSGHIGSNDNGTGGFEITANKLYNTKSALTESKNGVYIGTDGIGLGGTTTYDTASGGSVTRSMFQVNSQGELYTGNINAKGRIHATSGYIGDKTNGFTITSTYIANGKTGLSDARAGVYIGKDGIGLGTNSPFKVTNAGVLTATSGYIGGWTLAPNSLSNQGIVIASNNAGYASIYATNDKWYIKGDGTVKFKEGEIGGATIANSSISAGTGDYAWAINSNGSVNFKYGTIGGWNIEKDRLRAKNISIKSDGSIYHSNNGNSNWGIESDGSAYFTDVYITGVDRGSTFGDMGYDNDGYTWGHFSGGSTYGSSNETPFEGNCTTHIESLAVAKIKADKADIGYLVSSDIESINVTAKNLKVAYANITDVKVKDAQIDSIDAGKIKTGTISTERLNCSEIWNKGVGAIEDLEATKSFTFKHEDVEWGYISGQKCLISGGSA